MMRLISLVVRGRARGLALRLACALLCASAAACLPSKACGEGEACFANGPEMANARFDVEGLSYPLNPSHTLWMAAGEGVQLAARWDT